MNDIDALLGELARKPSIDDVIRMVAVCVCVAAVLMAGIAAAACYMAR